MADLGALGCLNGTGQVSGCGTFSLGSDPRLPLYGITGTVNGSAPQALRAGKIVGSVKIAGVAVQGARVILTHRRNSDQIIETRLSASDGSFTFTDLELTEQYCVTAYDPTSTYDAVTYDMITPVPT